MEEIRILGVAKEYKLNENQTKVLVGLFKLRFPNEQFESYVSEWAERIKKDRALDCADTYTTRILNSLGVFK